MMSEFGKDLFVWIAGCLSGLGVLTFIEVVTAWPAEPEVGSAEKRMALVFAAAGGGAFLWWFA